MLKNKFLLTWNIRLSQRFNICANISTDKQNNIMWYREDQRNNRKHVKNTSYEYRNANKQDINEKTSRYMMNA